jgi:excisionase family DNA binding protein
MLTCGNEEFLTPAEVCKLLRWSRKTFYRRTHWIKGRPPAFSFLRDGGLIKVRKSAIEMYLRRIEVR